MNRAVRLLAATLFVFACTTDSALAQESRGSIAGLIVDSSGGALPGVTVTIVNNGTNATNVQVTNESGQYTALFLQPGTYNVLVELSGFQKKEHQNIQVHVGERVQLDVTLAPAGIAESVQVVGESPQLETGRATIGQVIDSKLISEIPLGDGTAYGLTRLIPGASFERSYALQRPMDNDNLRGMTITGTINSEFTIDGSSNVVSQARAGIQPPSDAIEEFKVETAAYDAQIGHTGAGAVNLALRSGTNQFHGAASYYNRDDSRSANLFASNRNGSPKSARDYNRYSGTIGGPVFRNKTFFLFSYEKLSDNTIESFGSSVPTAKMRTGDFSELLSIGVQIFDPATARLVNGVVTRDPFPNNVIPAERINPIAKAVMGYYPAPNRAPSADFGDNFFVEQPWTYAYNFQMTKVDHAWTNSHNTYGRFIRNFRREERFNFAGSVNGVEITRGATDRFNFNYAVGHTAVLSPSMVLDVKGSWLRFNDDLFPLYEIDPATLGFSASTLGLLGGYSQLPSFAMESNSPTTTGRVARLGAQQSGFNSGRNQPFYNVQFAPTVTKTTGSHTWKFGYDWRQLRQKEANLGWKGGAYSFNGEFTRASAASPNLYGQGIAQFLLGLPAPASFIETRSVYDASVISHSAFVHDDWRVSDRLTLNLGLRYDLELGMTEAENRNVAGFDLTTTNPIEAAARARFALNPPAGLPFSANQFNVAGGYTYLSDSQPRAWKADNNNFQPRFGATYKLNESTVVRGGAGLFIAPFQIQGVPGITTAVNQTGYSRPTPVPVTSDNGLTFQANLSNPIPSGQLLAPNGSSLGLATNLGGTPGNVTLNERINPEYWRYSVGVERQIAEDFLIEVSYLGQKGRHLPILEALNYVPQQYRTQSLIRDANAEAFLSQTVANPFQGLMPDSPASNGATIVRRRLLLPYPQFDGSGICTGNGTFCAETDNGSNVYHGAIIRADKRFTHGFMVMSSYTWSRMREKVTPLNPWEEPEERVAAVDRPHRITFASVLELPFGRDRRWGTSMNPIVEGALGGWQLSGKFEWQVGQPLVFNNNTYFDPACGDPKSVLKTAWGDDGSGIFRGVDVPAMDTTCFYTTQNRPFTNAAGQPVTFGAGEIQLAQTNIRRFPTTMPNVRFMNHHLLDLGLSKNIRVSDSVRVQVRIEALNATNYTLFGSGNVNLDSRQAPFMRITNTDSSTVMKPRDIQIGARITF